MTPIERSQHWGTFFYRMLTNAKAGKRCPPSAYTLPQPTPLSVPQLKRQEIVITIWSCNHLVGWSEWIAARDHVRAVCPILRRGGQWLSERVIYNLLWLPTSTAANPDKCFNYGLFYICNLSDATKKAPNCIAPTYPEARNLRQFKQLRIIIIVYFGKDKTIS